MSSHTRENHLSHTINYKITLEREGTNVRYIKIALSYKFKPEGNTYKQAHYREVTPEEDFHAVKIDTLHLFSNLFDKLVYLEGINVTEVSGMEYQAGRVEEDAELRFLQQITLDGCVS
ncbi:hypothetical protein QUG02_10220 [Bacillus hominis]|uniref:DUF3888 domain-containing protein n=1 Tax=Bacillus hominis TaxID=2817478 RepID=A0ABT7R6E2_9BACI|nr:hypothetical protein [Bacillus hominis]EJQ52723.1 hypothetical protein IEQ_01766 [Bacillus cereus BAG6X1-2]MDM5193354.1 hypothetical protein [Bacillus hominis]MDM5433076.1 hypothetical protein [Bacillus hominis]MDM5438498.1 hypothetical protein [Bacillus hominis]